MGRVDGGLTSSCPQRHLHLSLLRHKVFLLIVAVTAAHYAGAIPREKAALSWGAAMVRQGWHRLQAVVHATHADQVRASSILSWVYCLSPTASKRLGDACNTITGAAGTSASIRVKSTLTVFDPSSLTPPCGLVELNREYIRVLMSHRRQASQGAPDATFDAGLFKGCREFNKTLEWENLLRHDPNQPGAELAGMSTVLVRNDPAALAKYIWTQFHNSPRHALIQANPSLTRVAVSSTARFWVVRLQTR